MNGFASHAKETTGDTDRRDIAPISNLTPAEVDAMVRQARVLRAAYIADWFKRTTRAWSSLFPRRRHLLPRGFSRWQTLPH